ncbi:carboxy terminal-processing peptidase [Luteolibacter pohnpeiensis]|uniref:Carboxy terminal-processing peptidase n=1 Tax=Luteolibacter pohnpeiensis TaxID=454153 RepID=A0A934S5F5_9BACT|nr:carboxy terminal-processing peptidase [Luteolibacter pohnpeiensis]MBK1881595.1 carboxy terminal-processing peptidase [Luteolibacter pohnpeiensis]
MVLCASIAAASCSACAQQADFNEVGKQMAIMLQNTHFARLNFDSKLSEKFLEDYLKDLDGVKLYFTQEDIDTLKAKYGDRLHTMLLEKESMPVAVEIYKLFQTRVNERVEFVEKLLKDDSFDFTKEEFVQRSRKDASWPKDKAEAEELWRKQIKEAVLSETLRREMLTKLAKEQGKPDPGKDDRDPKEKISLRYKRFQSSVNDVDDEDMANYFLSAVARTYDPHTDYMSDREMEQFKSAMKNELIGIGALLGAEEDGATKIMGIVVGGPADREGSLKLNDRVVAVDSLNTGKPEDMIDIMFMKIDKVVEYIRGKEGTSVALKVEPAGGAPGETKIIVIKREKVEIKDEQASGDVIEMKNSKGQPHRIGVLTLPSFYADFDEGTTRCSVDVERILRRMKDEKIDGLVLDLRGNGGGSLEEVRRMTGFFIPRGGPVVQVKNTMGVVQVKEADYSDPIYDGPMVVMTDKSSASASEILAGALQDFNRAVIVGESSTFGKGTVQQPMDISRMLPLFSVRNKAGALKVTIQKFYRPSGSSTQLDGVASDLVLPSLMDALDVGEAYLDNVLPHDRIRPASDFKPLPAEALFVPKLKELSQARVKENQDFSYVIEDVLKAKERIEANKVSLNLADREKELTESETQQRTRNSERRKRFSEIAANDKKTFRFFKLSLDDAESGAALPEYDPSAAQVDYMRRSKDEAAELDDTPDWPSGLDPVKRESLNILEDLVDLTQSGDVAGVIKK